MPGRIGRTFGFGASHASNALIAHDFLEDKKQEYDFRLLRRRTPRSVRAKHKARITAASGKLFLKIGPLEYPMDPVITARTLARAIAVSERPNIDPADIFKVRDFVGYLNVSMYRHYKRIIVGRGYWTAIKEIAAKYDVEERVS